jgi:hypothetical protein
MNWRDSLGGRGCVCKKPSWQSGWPCGHAAAANNRSASCSGSAGLSVIKDKKMSKLFPDGH